MLNTHQFDNSYLPAKIGVSYPKLGLKTPINCSHNPLPSIFLTFGMIIASKSSASTEHLEQGEYRFAIMTAPLFLLLNMILLVNSFLPLRRCPQLGGYFIFGVCPTIILMKKSLIYFHILCYRFQCGKLTAHLTLFFEKPLMLFSYNFLSLCLYKIFKKA